MADQKKNISPLIDVPIYGQELYIYKYWLIVYTLFVSSLAKIKETGKRFRHSFYFSNPENHKTCCLTPRWPQLCGSNGTIVIQHELGGCSVHEPLLGSTWYCITLFLLQSLKALRAPKILSLLRGVRRRNVVVDLKTTSWISKKSKYIKGNISLTLCK